MTLLAQHQILARLTAGEIFARGTFREANIRGAGYDLRVADDLLTVKDRSVPEGTSFGDELRLPKGEVAWVSVVERFRMPWDMAANIGVRFRFAQKGLLVFTGLLVDPGFGQQKDQAGNWDPQSSERLQLFIANIGDQDPIAIRLGEEGDRVLSLQFFEIDEPEIKRKAGGPPREQIPDEKLAVFSQVRELEQLESKHYEESQALFRDLRQDLLANRREIDTATQTSDKIVVFGVFLVVITLIGVIVTILLQAVSSKDSRAISQFINDVDVDGLDATVVIVAALLATSGLIAFIAFTIGQCITARMNKDRTLLDDSDE